MLTKLKQETLIKYGSYPQFINYVSKNSLHDDVVTDLIKGQREDLLCSYIEYQQLSESQISQILSAPAGLLLMAVLKRYHLSSEQQQQLIKLNNVLLLEAYLMPEDVFDISRRFDRQAERLYINSMIKNEKLVGVELFKSYVHNTFRDIVTYEVLDDLLAHDTWITRYLLKRGFMDREMEEYMVEHAPLNLLEMIVRERSLRFDTAQILLTDRNFDLAKEHFMLHHLRAKALDYYHRVRRARIENNP